MVGKFEVGKKVDLGKLSRESDGRESCSREKDVAPFRLGMLSNVLTKESNILNFFF